MPASPGVSRPRLIPAPAGNTHQYGIPRSRVPAHPRACGEHHLLKTRGVRPSGSSPRLRGTHRLAIYGYPWPRLIPAPAGNTRPVQQGPRDHPAHPRACGEHSTLLLTTSKLSGSSPRLRGTLFWLLGRTRFCRLIPAPAGNTHQYGIPRERVPAHPRACGEHLPVVVISSLGAGSSPRLRGTPRQTRLEPSR